LKVTLVSPYHGGSHQAWATGYQAASQHDIEILDLPARFWKWRMHGGAVTLARRFLPPTDLILATDMLDLSTFLSLTRPETSAIPTVLYMHENQLTYPLPEDPMTGAMRRQHGERDRHYAFINFTSMLSADRVLFNSSYHLDSWFDSLPAFLKHFPEYNELEAVEDIRAKSEVLPVGIDTRSLDRLAGREGESVPASSSPGDSLAGDSLAGDSPAGDASPGKSAPLVLWNQRWEYDKNPGAFFDALFLVADEGIPFRVALCGERFSQHPEEFEVAIERLEERIEHVGFAEPSLYTRLLWEATVTVSTAHHEFFGISILEAIHCGTFPILPERLSYPELLPRGARESCLYSDPRGLVERLRWALLNADVATRFASDELVSHIARYDWRNLAPVYDGVLQAVAADAASLRDPQVRR
jgi:glycosyltransferase involved in cell wall biosynthesis